VLLLFKLVLGAVIELFSELLDVALQKGESVHRSRNMMQIISKIIL